ncbi:MAG: hypothetical protein KJO39_06985 [Bacteroidia bacterium]|nr:hypothetical protein [Bacteroidia bacterium]NNF31240.1 hypothetical protein [Flavobacteriaceae bacterium]NNK54565.1 hypothetical protein [Flavobacteriaceae bacterium]NNM09366.1 hypothetical protein [Flavobacteriaceae bacterium]
MPETNQSPGLFKKLDNLFSSFITWVSNVFSSVVKFTKASILSLLIIVFILLLLTKMDQAFTMFVDLIEANGFKWGLMFSFFMINALALALSHYPIYNYYAANLNNSASFTTWEEVYPFKPKGSTKGRWLYRLFKVFIFHEKPGGNYKKDDRAHYMRYSIGLLIHAVWILFIIKTFMPKFNLSEAQTTTTMWAFFALCFVPLLHYIYVRRAVQKAKQVNNTTAIYKRLASRFTFLLILTFAMVITCLVFGSLFSRIGFFILVFTCYLFMFNYLYFRILRTKLAEVVTLFEVSGSKLTLLIMRIFKRLLYKSEHYLLLFSFNFIISIVIVIWTTYMAIRVGDLPNGTPILLAYFYTYYFIIAAIGKFFFAYRKIREQISEENGEAPKHSFRFKLVCFGIFMLLSLFAVGMMTESRTHELELVDHDNSNDLHEVQFINDIRNIPGNTVFFIASHGGGLKSNAWTLHVLEKLHRETNDQLMDRTIAFSGASGGSLGLALYTGLSKELSGKFSNDMKLLEERIDIISEGNYTSSDLTLTFGLDSFRKLWPFNREYPLQDRPYYAMIKYQNYVEDSIHHRLSRQSFRSFWKDVYEKRGYFPSLIMNTAATTGRRGILWSVKANNFDNIFHFSEDLAELSEYSDGDSSVRPKTLSFYEAVSTTNRFPVFSPAAKIPGYGHYIDAGAIDNSGLLGCLDLYLYLQSKDNFNFFQNKKVVFIEIINSKTLYLDNLLKKIEQDPIQKEENETDNIIADLQTALNLDKIPGYVSDFVDRYNQAELIKIFMPHKVTIGDVESYLNGKIENKSQRQGLINKLKAHNSYLDSITERGNGQEDTDRFFKEWNTYEPTLSRHLSESSLLFIKEVLDHNSITESIKRIKDHIDN